MFSKVCHFKFTVYLLHIYLFFYDFVIFRCTKLMNYFTKQQRLGYRKFHLAYKISYYAYLELIFLWIAQCGLIILRIICMVDFEFQTTLVRKKKKDEILEDEEVSNQLMVNIPESDLNLKGYFLRSSEFVCL